jgi:hypothetical protein
VYVFEIETPGSFIESDNRQWSWETANQLGLLTRKFFGANSALNLFEEACAPRTHLSREEWERAAGRGAEIRAELERALDFSALFAQRAAIDREVDLRFKRERWASGHKPREFEHGRPFIYAREFLYSLDVFDRVLAALAKANPAMQHLTDGTIRMRAAFPTLRGVRNSGQHIDERSLGLGPGGAPLNLQPINAGGIHAPGGALVMDNLNGSRFGCTMADGHFGEVDVSRESMLRLQQILQDVLKDFRWTGRPRHQPD